MEDAATAEISRSQIWQWIRHGKFTRERVLEVLDEEMAQIRAEVGDEVWEKGRPDETRAGVRAGRARRGLPGVPHAAGVRATWTERGAAGGPGRALATYRRGRGAQVREHERGRGRRARARRSRRAGLRPSWRRRVPASRRPPARRRSRVTPRARRRRRRAQERHGGGVVALERFEQAPVAPLVRAERRRARAPGAASRALGGAGGVTATVAAPSGVTSMRSRARSCPAAALAARSASSAGSAIPYSSRRLAASRARCGARSCGAPIAQQHRLVQRRPRGVGPWSPAASKISAAPTQGV